MGEKKKKRSNFWRVPHNTNGYAKDLLKMHEIATDHSDIIDMNGYLKVGMISNDITSDLSPYGEESRND